MAPAGRLTALQQAFWDRNGFQCGFCLSGMLFAAENLLARTSSPTETLIREAISGNLCRCTGYDAIVDAIASCAPATDGGQADRRPSLGRHAAATCRGSRLTATIVHGLRCSTCSSPATSMSR